MPPSVDRTHDLQKPLADSLDFKSLKDSTADTQGSVTKASLLPTLAVAQLELISQMGSNCTFEETIDVDTLLCTET